jgi:hypothetical protein
MKYVHTYIYSVRRIIFFTCIKFIIHILMHGHVTFIVVKENSNNGPL